MTKRGFGLFNSLDVHESVAIGREAESLGYDSVWLAEHNYSRDSITPCALLSAVTSRVTIGPCVVPIFTRSALLLATTFATLDEASRGRMILGLGAGSRVLIRGQGLNYRQPLQSLREYVEACRAVWSSKGEHINYAGEVARLEDAELDFEPQRTQIPIWIGSTGPRACELAGEIGDGVMLNAFLPDAYVRSAIDWIRAGATRANRSLDGFEVSMMIVTSVADSKLEAHEFMRPLLSVYLARLPDITRHTSAWGNYDELVELVDREGATGGARLISDELIDELTICGTEADCRKQLAKYIEAGVTHPVIAGVGDVRRALTSLAPST